MLHITTIGILFFRFRYRNTIFVPFLFLNINVYWYLEHKYEGAIILWLAIVTSLNTRVSLSWNSNWGALHVLCGPLGVCVLACMHVCAWVYLYLFSLGLVYGIFKRVNFWKYDTVKYWNFRLVEIFHLNVLYLGGQMIDKGNYNSQKCDQFTAWWTKNSAFLGHH